MDQEALYQEFVDAGAILHGHFVLSSGLHSNTYIQCARALMNPARADRLCAVLANKLHETIAQEIELVVAPAMGGVVVGYEMGRQLSKETIFCERAEGKFALRRGFQIEKGQKVLVVEDVVTTGKSSLEAFECIREAGGDIVAEACLIDRSVGQAKLGVPLVSLIEVAVPSYSEDELPEELKKIPVEKPGSRFLKVS